jgi:hypothetical protein
MNIHRIQHTTDKPGYTLQLTARELACIIMSVDRYHETPQHKKMCKHDCTLSHVRDELRIILPSVADDVILHPEI